MKKIKFIFASVFVFFILFVIAILSFIFVEPKAYDFMIKNVLTSRLPFDNTKNLYGHDDIVLVIIDNKSVEKYRWPWKRDLNNKVLNYFEEYAKPKVLVHDSIFTNLDIDNTEADRKYFEALKNFDNYVDGFMFDTHNYENQKEGEVYDKTFTEKYKIQNINIKTHLPKLYNSMLTSPKEFTESVKNLGAITVQSGFLDGYLTIFFGDETYRNIELLTNYKGSVLPSLSMKGYLTANNNPDITIDDKYINIPQTGKRIRYLKTPFMSIVPLRFYKRFNNGYSHIKYSAVDIMDSYDCIKTGKKPKISPDTFKDKYVVYGANASLSNGLNDVINTPLAFNHSGTDFQATSLDNIIHDDFLTILPLWVNVSVVLLCMMLVYLTIRIHKLEKAIIYTLLIILLTFIISSCCFYHGIVVFVAIPAIMCTAAVILGYIHRYLIEAKTKEKVENAMGKYVSEDVMKSVIKNIDNLGLGGKKAVVTVLFSDIRGFTSMSESMSAQEVSQLLNEYFSAMEPIVTKYNGIINKFIGDAVMAIFGEPIQDKNHPINAVKCGFEMLEKVKNLNIKWEKEGKPIIKIGIGVNTGEVFVGNIGSEKRMEYTVIGDTVNLASRLESYNKTFNTVFLISQSTFQASKEYIDVNKIADVEIRGKSQKMDIYELIDIKEQKDSK